MDSKTQTKGTPKMLHSQAARRWMSEQREKKLRRWYYHTRDFMGGFLWAVVFAAGATGLMWMWVIERTHR